MNNTVGIVGYGNFGAFIEELLGKYTPQTTIRVYSERYEPDGQKFFSLAEVCRCDVVILCASISAYEQKLRNITPLLGEQSVLIDVATVKVHTTQLLQKLLPDKLWISSHPMFGPESYKKQGAQLTGLRIVVCEHSVPQPQYDRYLKILRTVGFEIIEMSASEHDKLLAETLFLTHYVSQTILTAGFGRTRIDTVSFSYLMDAVESVRHDRQLFADVFRYNPYCLKTAEQYQQAQKQLDDSFDRYK